MNTERATPVGPTGIVDGDIDEDAVGARNANLQPSVPGRVLAMYVHPPATPALAPALLARSLAGADLKH